MVWSFNTLPTSTNYTKKLDIQRIFPKSKKQLKHVNSLIK